MNHPQLFELIIDTPDAEVKALHVIRDAEILVHVDDVCCNVLHVDATKGQMVEALMKRAGIAFQWADSDNVYHA